MRQHKDSDPTQEMKRRWRDLRNWKDWGGGKGKKEGKEEINISATWPLQPLPMTANIMKRYGSRERERNERDKKRTVK